MVQWLELSICVPLEYVEPVAEIFRRYSLGRLAIEERGFESEGEGVSPHLSGEAQVRAYLPLTPSAKRSRAGIQVGVKLISLLHPLPGLEERVLEEGEWETAWKSFFSLLRVGRHLVIKPSWQEYIPGQGDAVVELDPGLAFGTGHHPTTRMCLEALERLASPGMQVLDLGTGSGILAIGAAKLGASRVTAVDVDGVAVRVARANVRSNGVSHQVRLYKGGLPHPKVPGGDFDLVLANLNARALAEMAPYLADSLKPGGSLVVSGVLTEQERQVEAHFISMALLLESRMVQGEWVTLTLRRSAS